MKKNIFYVATLVLSLGLGMTGCDDNTDVCKEHILTPDEIAEIERQDSIRNEQMNKINADLVLEYQADITISQVAYDGTHVLVEIDKIAELFEISEEELLAGIALEDGAPEIQGFAIEGSTHADKMTASNSNSTWGHWFDADGNVVAWGDNAMVCCEYNTEDKFFNVMQFPKHLVDGQKVKVIEGLKYGEKRAAVVITIIAHGAEEITAPIVSTQKISIDVNPASTYDMNNVKFDVKQVMADLGISSMDDAKYVGVKTDGSYAQESDAGTNGFWYDEEGFASGFSDDARVYTSYGGDDWAADEIGIGQNPGKMVEGDQVVIKYGILANNKIAMIEITVNVVPYDDPETVPSGDPITSELAVNLSKDYDNTYSSIRFDVKEVLREAFKMTTYQIHRARVSGDLKIYCGEESAEDPSYTADAPGYWLSQDGASAKYADGFCWVSLGTSETELYLYGGNHPENVDPSYGVALTTKYIITCNGGKVIVTLNFEVKGSVNE